jgi:hypothetical protein
VLVVAYHYVTSYLRLGAPCRWWNRTVSDVTGSNSSIGSMRFVRLQCRTCGRFMPHNGAWDGISALVPAGRYDGGGVMVRRLTLASRDSGAESPVYVGEPSAPAGRGASATGDVPPTGATRSGAATVDLMSTRHVVTGRAATRRKPRHVGHRPAKQKMVCKGHPCIYAADGNPMTWFASSRAVSRGRCGRRSLRIAAPPRRHRKRTDVHGREG